MMPCFHAMTQSTTKNTRYYNSHILDRRWGNKTKSRVPGAELWFSVVLVINFKDHTHLRTLEFVSRITLRVSSAHERFLCIALMGIQTEFK